MTDSHLLNAFKAKNTRVPVWFMRQAGRFLPEYQKIKKNYSLNEMFRAPEIAAQVTLLPVDILKVDAAILFADILTLPSAMGFKVDFIDGKGPVIGNALRTAGDIKKIKDMGALKYISQTIKIIKNELPRQVPLIGFAGAPFTVASYLIASENSTGINRAVRFALEQPQAFHQLMEKITRNTIAYLNLQKDAGIQVFQLFDTWGGILRESDYQTFVLPYVQKIFESVRLPSIYYLKNCSHLMGLMRQSKADFLSVCETVTLGDTRFLTRPQVGIQGNLYNGLLYAPEKVLLQEVRKILQAARRHHPKFIFNLSHGIFPDVDVNIVKRVVQEVQKFPWA